MKLMEKKFNWYVMRVVSGKELKIKDLIMAEVERIGKKDLIKQIVVPTTRVVEIKEGKKKVKEKALYGGYIFIEMVPDLELLDYFRRIEGYRGFMKDKSGNLAPMKESDVLRVLQQAGQTPLQSEEPFQELTVGEKVKIIEGPLSNFVGEIEEINLEKRIVKVAIKIFGRKTPVELSITQVEKIA